MRKYEAGEGGELSTCTLLTSLTETAPFRARSRHVQDEMNGACTTRVWVRWANRIRAGKQLLELHLRG
jgi:hypothetical protein